MDDSEQRYLIEKTSSVVSCLQNIQHYIDQYDDLKTVYPTNETVKEIIEGDVWVALQQAIKILAMASQAGKWSTEDAERLLRGGKEALKLLYIKYEIGFIPDQKAK